MNVSVSLGQRDMTYAIGGRVSGAGREGMGSWAAAGKSRIGPDGGRIARTSRPELGLDGPAGGCLCRRDDLLDRGAAPRAEVERQAAAAVRQVLDGPNVRISQVLDVDVVTDRRPVWRRVVGSMDHQGVAPTSGDGEDDGDEVLRPSPVLAVRSIERRTRGVEIAQRDG